MARLGIEPRTLRFSVVGQPALTRSAERNKKWPFAGSFGTPPAIAAGRAVHEIPADTCGFRWVCAAMRGSAAQTPSGLAGYGVRSVTTRVAGRISEIRVTFAPA